MATGIGNIYKWVVVDSSRMVKIEFGKRGFVLIGLVIVFLSVGYVYAYGGSIPSVIGHSASELEVDNAFCIKISGHNCGYDNNDVIFCEDSCESTSACGIQYYCGLQEDCGRCTWRDRFSGWF